MKRKKVYIHLDSGRGYSRELLKGIYEYNNAITHWSIIFQSAYYLRPEDFARVNLYMIRAYKPDGCILAYCNQTDELLRLGIPIIQTTSMNQVDAIPYIKGDYDADGKLAVEYFMGIGFKNIGFFGLNKLSWSKGRCDSLREHAARHRLNLYVYDQETHMESINYSENFTQLAKWLISLPKPIGILACNDDFGQILINACRFADIRVPYEVAVLGVDNDELICNITFPNMSSISRNLIATAANMCQLLSDMMEGKPARDRAILTVPSEVVVRQSTDTIASGDPEIVKAISFIRQNAHLPLTVEQVVAATALSKRSLYTRFRDTTGHSIYHEIQYTRLQRFKKLLKDSNLPVSTIAYQMGFDDVTHVSRWIRSLTGVSPSQWKKDNTVQRVIPIFAKN